jgi:alanyl-tRNA synthetase
MTTAEIREAFLSFFEERGHKRLEPAPLVPAAFDPSVLFTIAGMHPLKPYFLGHEQPPHNRLTSCQPCFRTPDIDIVGTTTRHLTFFEMLGNFSIGDYFKQGAVEFAWEASLEVFGFNPDDIWITVFEGDEELGLGPDEEAIEAWVSVGVPRERIVLCNRKENFWQSGPTGPCGPCSELYLDRGVEFGKPDDLPGEENERFLEYWNLVFMQFDLGMDGDRPTLTPLPAQHIDTGLGLNRMALIQQGTETIFETDDFKPLIELGEQLSGRRYGEGFEVDRALRVLADHTRAATFLVADGVVPSNEDRGYVLRRIMRRAIYRGRSLGIDPGIPILSRYADVVTELMGDFYPRIVQERDLVQKWLRAEEESFNRTLDQGTRLLEELVARAKERGDEGIAADDAFRLHDTYGFPFDLTREMATERSLGVDEAGFEELMDQQRARARAASVDRSVQGGMELEGPPTEFTGYDSLEEVATVTALREDDRVVLKLDRSPFYAKGGGQISDAGVIACEAGDCRARVVDVVRSGDDQALVVDVEDGALHEGERVVARVDRAARHATEANHTATHLLHAALRERLGTHVRQAGSYVGPDKLRFDFTHGASLSPEELRDVEDRVNEWVLRNDTVNPQQTTLDEARAKGAMALFGEKYGDVVRMVEVGDGSYSRELCGGTHVRSTAEIGLFKVTTETSSASNVRRIEALTGPGAVRYMRDRDQLLGEIAATARTEPGQVSERILALQAEAKKAAKSGGATFDEEALAAQAAQVDGALVLAEAVDGVDAKALMDVADRLKGRLGDNAAIVLGSVVDARVHLVAAVTPALVARGVKAGEIVKVAAQVAGGGGGGRDTMAQAGGKDPEKLGEALAAARSAIEAKLKD